MMKTVLSILLSLMMGVSVTAQYANLPGPAANSQTLPTGSYVLAMDNTNQLNALGYFNLKSYGLAVHLLNNNVKLKWVIKTGKAKDAADFTVNASALIPTASAPVAKKITVASGSTAATITSASSVNVGMYITYVNAAGIQASTYITAMSGTNITLSLPATATISNKDVEFTTFTYPVSSYNFKAGPFVIFAADTTGVGALISSYNSSLSGSDKIKVYKTTASVSVDIRYDMSGFKPKANICNDGGNTNIHEDYFINCGITSTNYTVGSATDLYVKCYTFASEPHNDNAPSDVINAIKSFVQNGGNFLAECKAVETYENSALGRFQTTNGITVTNTGVSSASTIYPNPDLAYSQYEGAFDISQSGSCQNWSLASGSSFKNNAHNHATGGTIVTQTPIGASVSKLTSGALPGGLVYYIGNHNFSSISSIGSINGIRMYMNAFLTPVSINSNCSIGANLPDPLPVKLVSFNANLDQSQTKVSLTWSTATEFNTSHFVVERSIDGTNFTNAGTLTAAGNSFEKKYYQLTDNITSLSTTVIYYRLCQVDIDGEKTYSSTRIIRLSKQSGNPISLLAYPNPVSNEVHITIPSNWQNKKMTWELVNINGQTAKKMETLSSSQTETINTSGIAPGFYIIRVSCEGQTAQQKIIKQ